ncbi:MAG TPA: DUF2182 domain-containing protein, partial [Candidatus Binatia bacterium]|nr:DUF2182 domain-containing protein [Candidatus Binatia bacterium]
MNGVADRRVFLGTIGALVALAWMTLWIWDRSPYGRYLDHGRLAEIGAASLLTPVV